MNLNTKTTLFILILTGILIYIPFLSMALHTDEWGYLLMGKRILKNPWDPFHGTEKYEGEIIELKNSSTFAPLIPYYFAFIFWITGSDSEIILRLFFLLFSPIALVSAYYIAKRFLKNPFYSALLIAFSPAFFLLSHLTTTDISGLSFSLAGFALFLSCIEKNNEKLAVFAGLTIGISILIRYQNLYMIPLIFLYSLLFKKRMKRTFIVTLIAILILLPWCVHNIYHYGTLHILSASKAWKGVDNTYNPLNFLKSHQQKIVSSVVIFGSSFVFFPCIIAILLILHIKRIYLASHISNVLSLLIFGIFVLLIIFYFNPRYEGILNIQFQLFFISGTCFLLIISWIIPLFISRQISRKEFSSEEGDYLFLIGWFFLLELLIVVFLPFNSVRYSLPQLVPGLILFFKFLEDNFSEGFVKKFAVCCIVFTFFNGTAVAYGDYILADVYRDFANIKLQQLNHGKDKKVYFIGEEGFRGYMEKTGAYYLLRNDNSLEIGSIVVIPTFLHQYPINPDLMSRLKRQDTVIYNSKYPIRIVNPLAKTSFFCYYAGLLPYSLSKEPIEEFKVFEVEK